MSYTLDYVQAPNYSAGRGGNPVTTIVIHHWDDPAKNPSFDGVVRYIAGGSAEVSAHYVAEAGRVTQMVSENDTAWHAGNWRTNQRSIGIECNPRASHEDKQTVAALVRDIQNRYGALEIVGHMDVVSTSCPGRYYPPASVLAPYLNGAAPAAPSVPVSGDVDALARAVIRGDYGNGSERQRRLGDRYGEVQDRVNQILGSSAPAAPAPTPVPAPAVPAGDVDALARAVIRGDYGNGEERKNRLGTRYSEVQDRVNQILGGAPAAPAPTPAPAPVVPAGDVDALARAVIRGDYGNGEERKNRLGARYSEVQDRVNQILDGGSTPAAPDLNALADAVIRGDYGNGQDRKNRLGALYDQVQALVNQKLGY